MLLSALITLLAAAENSAPATPAKPGAMNVMFMVFMVLIAMYLLFVLPKKSQAKQTQKMIDSLNKNDRVMTNSGIIGLVYSIDKEAGEVVLKVDEANNTKIHFSIGAIYYVFRDKEDKKPDDKKADDKKADAKKVDEKAA